LRTQRLKGTVGRKKVLEKKRGLRKKANLNGLAGSQGKGKWGEEELIGSKILEKKERGTSRYALKEKGDTGK